MKSSDEADDTFAQTAADDSRRPELIKETSRKRTGLTWCAVLMSVCAFILMILGMISEIYGKSNIPSIAVVEFFLAALIWMQVLKTESDLRLLKLVEKLKSSTR
jgi:hypothetical protein